MTQDMERDYTELRDTYDKVVAERDAARKHLNSEYHARKAAERREAAAVGALRRIEEVAETRAAEGYNEAGRLKHIAEIARSALQAVEGGEGEQGSSVAAERSPDA